MVKPFRSDYQIAFQNPRSAFLQADLQSATPAVTRLGLPSLMSGSFAVVCQMYGSSDTWAVRAFVQDVPDLQRRYQLISAYLDGRRTPESSIVGFRYVPHGIMVNGQPHPIVVMDWVPGSQLDTAIGKRLESGQSLMPLADAWIKVVAELESLQIAHGDLQHGNILVDGDTIHLVDYDGMFVPTMAGMNANEHGHSNYQHPLRSRHGFNRETDRFSALLIYTALRAVEADPSLWRRYDMPAMALLFRKADLNAPLNSDLFNELTHVADTGVTSLVSMLRDSLLNGTVSPSLPKLIASQPVIIQSTTVTTGWWKATTSERTDISLPATPQNGHLGAGWVRAFLGVEARSEAGQTANIESTLAQVPYVASFSRNYVHLSTCDWAKQISKRNLIGFPTLDEAIASGYKPCKTCKPQQLRHELPEVPPTGGTESTIDPGSLGDSKKWDVMKVRNVLQDAPISPSPRSSARAQNATPISVSSQVRVRRSGGKNSLIRIVRAGAPTPTASHVTEDSPLGRALVGKRSGDIVVYREVGRWYRLTIVEVM